MGQILFSFFYHNAVFMNMMIVIGWVTCSFLFWRGLRYFAVEEDRVFDLTFYATLTGFVFSRAGFVISHWDLFAGKSPLLIAALWVEPGLSWVSGLVGITAALVLLSRQYKVRLGLVIDTLGAALPYTIGIGELGAFLTSAETGKGTSVYSWLSGGRVPWVPVRHPVSLYELITVIVIGFVISRMGRAAVTHKWPYGLVGVWFFVLYAVSGFALEFLKDSRVYWGNLTANQWMLIGIFAECIGVLYVRGGGREYMRPRIRHLVARIQEKGLHIYESISRRHAH